MNEAMWNTISGQLKACGYQQIPALIAKHMQTNNHFMRRRLDFPSINATLHASAVPGLPVSERFQVVVLAEPEQPHDVVQLATEVRDAAAPEAGSYERGRTHAAVHW